MGSVDNLLVTASDICLNFSFWSAGNSSGLKPRFSAPFSATDSVLSAKKLALSPTAGGGGGAYALNTLTEGGGSSEGAGREPSRPPKKSAEAGAAGAASLLLGASNTSSTDFIDRPPSTCLSAGFLILFANFWASSSALSAITVGGLGTTGSSFVI